MTISYAHQLESLTEIFPTWSQSDLLGLLDEVSGDLSLAISRISEGHAEQWTVQSGRKKLTSTTPAVRGRGSFRGRGRGRGGHTHTGDRNASEPQEPLETWTQNDPMALPKKPFKKRTEKKPISTETWAPKPDPVEAWKDVTPSNDWAADSVTNWADEPLEAKPKKEKTLVSPTIKLGGNSWAQLVKGKAEEVPKEIEPEILEKTEKTEKTEKKKWPKEKKVTSHLIKNEVNEQTPPGLKKTDDKPRKPKHEAPVVMPGNPVPTLEVQFGSLKLGRAASPEVKASPSFAHHEHEKSSRLPGSSPALPSSAVATPKSATEVMPSQPSGGAPGLTVGSMPYGAYFPNQVNPQTAFGVAPGGYYPDPAYNSKFPESVANATPSTSQAPGGPAPNNVNAQGQYHQMPYGYYGYYMAPPNQYQNGYQNQGYGQQQQQFMNKSYNFPSQPGTTGPPTTAAPKAGLLPNATNAPPAGLNNGQLANPSLYPTYAPNPSFYQGNNMGYDELTSPLNSEYQKNGSYQQGVFGNSQLNKTNDYQKNRPRHQYEKYTNGQAQPQQQQQQAPPVGSANSTAQHQQNPAYYNQHAFNVHHGYQPQMMHPQQYGGNQGMGYGHPSGHPSGRQQQQQQYWPQN